MNRYLLHKRFLRAMALLGVLTGVAVALVSYRVLNAYPERQVLTQVEGVVEFVSLNRYALDFKLKGDPRVFSYARKSGRWQEVDAALRDVASQPIKILIDTSEHEPAMRSAEGARFEVYELSNAKAVLQTYEEVLQAWQADHRFVYLLVPLCLLAAGSLEFRARKIASSR